MAQSYPSSSHFAELARHAAPVTSRPTNVARSVFHVASGLVALLMIRVMPSQTWLIAAASAFAISAWTMEISRRQSLHINKRLMAFFGPVAHPDEWHRVNSATWYATALVLLSVLASPLAAEMGVITLAVADPAAAVIGRRFGRVKLVGKKSLEGSLGFVLVGASVTFVWLALASPLSFPVAVAVALSGAVAGAVAELLSTRFDDNFTIPVVTAGAVSIARLLLVA